MLNFSVKKVRIFLWSLLGAVVVFLLWQGVVPTGGITYSTNLKERNDFIGKLSPDTRVEKKGRKIIGNPVYFSLRTPRNFQKARLTLTYKNKDFSVMEAGMLVDGDLWRYKTLPLENKILDRLMQKWSTVSLNDLILLQKEKKFSSIKEFRKDPPLRRKMAIYNYDWDKKFFLPDYTATTSEQTITVDLKGDYQIYTYIKQKKLDFEFNFQDKNENKDVDPVDINLYSQGEKIKSKHRDDNGVAEDIGEDSKIRTVSLEVPDLAEGVYKIEVKANDDIITRSIQTPQKKLSFAGKVRLASSGEEQKIYTTGENLSAKIVDPASLQTLRINNQGKTEQWGITETYKRFSTSLKSCSPCELNLENGGVALFGNGVFSFSKKALLDPSIAQVDADFDPEEQGVKYILARYESPKKENGYTKATVEFNLNRGYQEEDKYNFMLSIPGLKAEDEAKKFVEIKKIKVELEGRSILVY